MGIQFNTCAIEKSDLYSHKDFLVASVRKRHLHAEDRIGLSTPLEEDSCRHAEIVKHFSAVIIALTAICLVFSDRLTFNPQVVTFLHLLTFSAHFGAQCWVTFIAGITMFFNLPRIMFGRVQCRLFPLYFGSTLLLSCVTLLTFTIRQSTSRNQDNITFYLLGACVAFTFINSFYLASNIVSSMINVFELEKGSHVAFAVGFCDRTELKKQPGYIMHYKRFRVFHGISGVANILTLICNLMYMYHLACVCEL
ncbi:TM205-like protein [Mya arenaria]|uniref:TM205-like protein n=1 Tax=Mya arenaria TaxID=6604 RepID=A0ABY7F4S2_MYAAR|nr:TM205-like protein [Mya arenaria]